MKEKKKYIRGSVRGVWRPQDPKIETSEEGIIKEVFSKEIPRTQSLGFLCAGTHRRLEMSEESPVPRRVSVKSQARGDENGILETQREKNRSLTKMQTSEWIWLLS